MVRSGREERAAVAARGRWPPSQVGLRRARPDEGMGHCFGRRRPLLRILDEELGDDVLRKAIDLRLDQRLCTNLAEKDSAVQLILIQGAGLLRTGVLVGQQDVEHHPQRPAVALHAVGKVLVYDLRGLEVARADLLGRGGSRVTVVALLLNHGKAKVDDLGHTPGGGDLKQTVLKLEVPVHGAIVVAVGNGHDNVTEQDTDLLMVISRTVKVREVTSDATLHNEVDVLPVLEELVEPHQRGMVQLEHCLELRVNLLHVDLGLWELLDRTLGPPREDALRCEDHTEATPANLLEHVIALLQRSGGICREHHRLDAHVLHQARSGMPHAGAK
mmetsp:Transcript_35847/g.81000  ORF Transcript_35847/g.81000 Transcript_35847/m.81000 type:complete len:330 (+) Transcript_35847:598-1587(+)